jgi:N utilization substance protein A
MSEISNAIKQICDEKGLSYAAVIVTIESALAAAYRKDFGEKNQNIKVEFDPEDGKSKVFDMKTVVEDMPEEVESDEEKKEEEKVEQTQETEEKRKFNPKTEIQMSDAKLIKKTAKIGDEIKTKLAVPDAYGRMAAQTAKQVIIQKLREAEREMIFNEFKEKEHEVVAGVIQRHEGRIVLVDLGKAVGILPGDEQIRGEQYNPGQRIKVFIKEVNITSRGPEIILSRTSDEILKKVFYLEIPEISNGLVEIKSVAREAGSRSKVAVSATSDNVDPIGSCVGQRGARIQTIISELGGEKIDIIEYNENLAKFVANALSPAKTISVNIDEKNKKALVNVAEDQLSLAIGRDGQNVRLAARLTGWKIDITGEKAGKAETEKEEKARSEKEEAKTEELKYDNAKPEQAEKIEAVEKTEKKKKEKPKKEDKPKKEKKKTEKSK